jgi:hypothetical protein
MSDYFQPLHIRPRRAQVKQYALIMSSVILSVLLLGLDSLVFTVCVTLVAAVISLIVSRQILKGQEVVFDRASGRVWVRELWSKETLDEPLITLTNVTKCSLSSNQDHSILTHIVSVSVTSGEADNQAHHTLESEPQKQSKRGTKKARRKKGKKSKHKDQQLDQVERVDQNKDPQWVNVLITTDYGWATEVHRLISIELNTQSQGLREQVKDRTFDKKEDHTNRYSKGLIGILILFFGLQLWVVGSYYTASYPWDERFSWRMFSTVRSLSCQVQVWRKTDQGTLCPDGLTPHCRPMRLSSKYHMVWVNLLKRGRLQVLDRVAKEECVDMGEDGAVFINLSCPSATPPHSLINVQSPQVNLCQMPKTRRP